MVNIPSYLQPYTGDCDVVEVSGGTIAECLDQLVEQFPNISKVLFAEGGRLLEYVSVYLNGELADVTELTGPVNDGDELHILYLLGGG